MIHFLTRTKIALSTLFFITVVCNAQNLNLNILEHHFGIDEHNSLVVSHINHIENFNDTSYYTGITIKLNEVSYSFNEVPDRIDYTNFYWITDLNTLQQYKLYFTSLPIINISSSTAIIDDPKVLASFSYSDQEQIVVSNVGIELRGGSSLSFPKKTFDLEFWEDDIGDDTHNVRFKNMRSDDDWILDGIYNEPLRIRSNMAHKLWLEMHAPHYIVNEPEAKSGANVEYVELFLNGVYNGLYNLSEQVDRKQLKIKSYNGSMRGELYKGDSWGASTFGSLPTYSNTSREWGGYEKKYPNKNDVTDWSNLYQFTDFVMNSSDSDFGNDVWSNFNFDNFTDYFLFLNLLRATDNTGKNIYLAKYNKDEPYFYIPWDLDGCFGTIWNGANENISDDVLVNGFISRVLDLNSNNEKAMIASKWLSYRNSIFHQDTLVNSITTQYNFLLNNRIYEREYMVYPNYSFSPQDVTYTLDWLNERLLFLDTYFLDMLPETPPTTANQPVFLYPNPTNSIIYIAHADSLISKYYELFDYAGKLIKKGNLESNQLFIDNLKSGTYFIILEGVPHTFIIN